MTTTDPKAIAGAFIAGLFSNLLKDEAAVLQPVADSYLTNIIGDPSPDNVVAQSLAYQAQAVAVLPKAESVGVFDTATAVKAFIDAQVPALVAQASAAVTTDLTATSSASSSRSA